MLLIGAGDMAKEYIKVLKALATDFQVVGRSKARCESLAQDTDTPVISGGLHSYLDSIEKIPNAAIVAVSAEQLTSCTLELIEAGVKQILVEKPAGLSLAQIERLSASASDHEATVSVAYNRRYLSSVAALQERIAVDGGVTSFHFEFTEWAHVIGQLDKSDEVLQKWLLANSTHIIDLAFYLGGAPKQMNCYQGAPLSWHKAGGSFVGSGVSEDGPLFSYMANWNSAGRWSLEFMTDSGRYKLCPIEQLQFQPKGTVAFGDVAIDDSADRTYKPGLLAMVDDFANRRSSLPDIKQHVAFVEQVYRIAGYPPQ